MDLTKEIAEECFLFRLEGYAKTEMINQTPTIKELHQQTHASDYEKSIIVIDLGPVAHPMQSPKARKKGFYNFESI
ncbi:MAG TPA: hypothetical protein VJ876_06955 [Bacteroidales bacterium]|nr:hypothetical protein [Bacteroidales bacterium]